MTFTHIFSDCPPARPPARAPARPPSLPSSLPPCLPPSLPPYLPPSRPPSNPLLPTRSLVIFVRRSCVMTTGARRGWRLTAYWVTESFSTFRGPIAVSFIPAPRVSTVFLLHNKNESANSSEVSNKLLFSVYLHNM